MGSTIPLYHTSDVSSFSHVTDTVNMSSSHRLLPSNTSDSSGVHFIQVFVIVWGGSCLVTINAQLLRAKL